MSFAQLAGMVGGALFDNGGGSGQFTSVSIDSRTVAEKELFIAIRGDRNDGHRFIPQALQNGAAGVLAQSSFIPHAPLGETVPLVTVDNPHRAMIRMATEHRSTLDTKIIAVTGSNGKTTTKEMIYCLLKALGVSVFRSPGNYNNLFGVPLALFKMPAETQIAVFELGISTKDEMPTLATITRPDAIVITNIGPAHLDSFGTVRSVARAKLELVRNAQPDVPVIVNGDDPILMREVGDFRSNLITFGCDRDTDFKPDDIKTDIDGGTMVVIEGNRFRLSLRGEHQVYNLLAAYAAVRSLGYSFEQVDTEAIEIDTAPLRGETVTRGGVTFMIDCYNANPESVHAGLAAFASLSGQGRRLVVLGDMLELGADGIKYHREIGQSLAEYNCDMLALTGPLSIHIKQAALESGFPEEKIRHFDTTEQCAVAMTKIFQRGDIVYLKGSRGIGLEKIFELWTANEGAS